MRVDQDIKLEFNFISGPTDNDDFVDYTDGLINVNILRGIQSDYEGIYQQCEAGVLTIVSRNPQLDPYVNDDMRLSKIVRIRSEAQGIIFCGRINGFNVDYQSKGKPPIITMTAVDMIGTMALHTLRDSFLDLCSTGDIDLFRLIDRLEVRNYPSADSEIIGFEWDELSIADGNGNACGVSTPITALTMATNLAQSDGYFFFANNDHNALIVKPDINYNRDAIFKIQFDSRGGATSYRDIILDDGFDAMKNQIAIRSKDGNIPLYYNDYSVNEWGAQQANINTYLSGTTQSTETTALANKVLREGTKPTREVKYIVVDGTKIEEGVNVDLCDNIYIYHELDSFTINRVYGVIGIEHNITQDDWEIRYHLKNMFKYETAFPRPTIEVSPLNGDTDQDFTFSITNTDDLDLEGASYLWRYIGGTEPASLVNTTMSTSANPVINYDVLTTGKKVVRLRVTNSYGFNLISANDAIFDVYGIAPTGVSFTYTIDPANSGKYYFTAAISPEGLDYAWDFGDGVTQIGREVTHQYTTSDTYTVTLDVSNPFGTTTVTDDITVTVPAGPFDEVGTLGVRYIKLGMDQYNTTSGYYFPGMYKFKALTSYTNTNRASTLQEQYISSYEIDGEPHGITQWYRALDNVLLYSGNYQSNVTSNFLRADNDLGLRPYLYASGTANFGLVLDLNSVNYDIKTFDLDFSGTARPGSPTYLNVYVCDYVDDWPTGAGNPDPGQFVEDFYNNLNWIKVGTIARPSGVFTPIVTMPPNTP